MFLREWFYKIFSHNEIFQGVHNTTLRFDYFSRRWIKNTIHWWQTRFPGIKISLAGNIAMKYEHKFWTGDGTLIIRVNREAMLYFKTASILSTFNACKRWEVRERLLNPRLCFKRFSCVVSNLQTSKTNNQIITRLRLDKNKLNTCQGKYNNIPYDLRTCPRGLPQYHRKYGIFHCYLSSL